jgi:hypothetical protein
MTESEFLLQNPADYSASVLLFYAEETSSLVPEADNTEYPLYAPTQGFVSSSQYTIHDVIGLSVPFVSTNGVDLSATTTNVTSITFQIPTPMSWSGVTPGDYYQTQNGGLPVNQVKADVLSTQQQASWVYYKVENVRILNPSASGDFEPWLETGDIGQWTYEVMNGQNTYKYQGGSSLVDGVYYPNSESLFVFNAYVDDTFDQASENPLQNNATTLRRSQHLMESRRETLKPTVIGGSYPPNLPAIRLNTARPAAVPDSNFSSIGFRRGRYDGTKLTASYVSTAQPGFADGEVPILNLIEFLATTHSFSSSIADITAQPIDDRGDVQRLYFNPRIENINNAVTSSIILEGVDVPVMYDTVYTDVGNKVAKITNKLIVFTAEADNGAKGVRTTNEGYVIRIN